MRAGMFVFDLLFARKKVNRDSCRKARTAREFDGRPQHGLPRAAPFAKLVRNVGISLVKDHWRWPLTSFSKIGKRKMSSIPHRDTGAASRPGLWARLVFATGISLLAALIFWALKDTQHDNHRLIVQMILDGEADWPPNFLYYALVAGLGEIVGQDDTFLMPATVLIAWAVGAKAFFTTSIITAIAPNAPLGGVCLVTTVLLFIFPLPVTFMLDISSHFTRGNFTPNVWHNSTTMFLMPFALAAFLLQARNLEQQGNENIGSLTAWIAVGMLVKPSFFFAYAPTTALFLAGQFQTTARRWLGAVPLIVGTLMIGFLFVAIYTFQQGNIYEQPSHVVIRPFFAWSLTTPPETFHLALLASFIVPISYFAFRLKPERPIWLSYSLLLTAVAMLIYILLSETGPRFWHGNFYWQTVVCGFLLHTVIAADLLEKWTLGLHRKRVAICAALFLAMFVSGIAYLVRLIFLGVSVP